MGDLLLVTIESKVPSFSDHRKHDIHQRRRKGLEDVNNGIYQNLLIIWPCA
jgi:hypothetical protein